MNGRELLLFLGSTFLYTVINGTSSLLFGATLFVAFPARFISRQD